MPRGRFLSRSISESEQVAELSSDTARLIFTWMITHADVEGRMSANPRIVKGRVCPLLELSSAEVEIALEEMESLGLIVRYEHEAKRYLYFPKWLEHQQGIRRDREPVLYPPPPGSEDRGSSAGVTPAKRGSNSGITPAERGSSAGRREVKGSEGEVEVEVKGKDATTLKSFLEKKMGPHLGGMLADLPDRGKAWERLTLEQAQAAAAKSQKPENPDDIRSFRTRFKDNLDAAAGLAANPSGGERAPSAADIAARAAAVRAEEDRLWESLSAEEQAESERRAAEFLDKLGLEAKRPAEPKRASN